MTRQRTILQRFLPPWAPPKARYARVGDYVLLRGATETRVRLALVEDRSKDGQRIQVRKWNDSHKAWHPSTTWIARSVVVAVVGNVAETTTTPPEGLEGP